MDVMMPEINGWETVRKIVENGYYEGSLIFMLTALETPDEIIEDLQKYVVDYLTKPFEPKELVSTCQTYLSYLK
jgi:DNA-binding response OmpR family regulator